jgi:hypothetical protein
MRMRRLGGRRSGSLVRMSRGWDWSCDIAGGRLEPWVSFGGSVCDGQEDCMTAYVLLKGNQELVQGTLSRVEGKSTQSPVWVRLSNRNSCHCESTAATLGHP